MERDFASAEGAIYIYYIEIEKTNLYSRPKSKGE